MTSRRRAIVISTATAILLTACGGSDTAEVSEPADGEPTPTDPVVTEPEPVDTEPVDTEPEPADTEPVDTESEPEPVATEPEPVATEPEPEPVATEPEPVATEPGPAASSGDCLVGEWIIDNGELSGFYSAVEAAFPADAGPVPSFDVVGDVFLTFTETDYEYLSEVTLTLGISGIEATADANGTISGTWEVVEERVVTTLGSNDLDVQVSIGGEQIDGNEFADGLIAGAPINDAPFDCAGPTLGLQVGEDAAVRHDVTLRPA